MTVETCHRCRAVTDTDEDHRCPHGEYCQMLDGNTGDCRSYCHVCDDELRDAEVAALRACASITMAEKEATDALRARVAELEAQNGALKNDAAEMTEQAATMFARAATLECERDELIKPRSPNALELAMEYGIAHAVCVMHTDSSPFFIEGFARRSRAIAALVAYDKRK